MTAITVSTPSSKKFFNVKRKTYVIIIGVATAVLVERFNHLTAVLISVDVSKISHSCAFVCDKHPNIVGLHGRDLVVWVICLHSGDDGAAPVTIYD